MSYGERNIHNIERRIQNNWAEKYDQMFNKLAAYVGYRKYFIEKLYLILEEFLGKKGRNIKSLKLLDIGCGTGEILKDLENSGFKNLYGLDISKEMIKVASKKTSNVHYQVGIAEKMPFEDKYFDIVIGHSVLHHIPNLKKVFSEIHRVLVSDGIFYFEEPSLNWLFEKKGMMRQSILKLTSLLLVKLFRFKNRRQINSLPLESKNDFNPFHRHLSDREIIESIGDMFEFTIEKHFTLVPLFESSLFFSKTDLMFYYLLKKIDDTLFDKMQRGIGNFIIGRKK